MQGGVVTGTPKTDQSLVFGLNSSSESLQDTVVICLGIGACTNTVMLGDPGLKKAQVVPMVTY